jgi:hypothetical protein
MRPKLNEEAIYQAAVLSGELEIDSEGRIWRLYSRTGNRWGGGTRIFRHPRRRAENKTGVREYLQVRVMINWDRLHVQAHRLVYRHFHGPIPAGMTINHKNGSKADNRPENLEAVSPSENVLHSLHVLKRGRIDQNGTRNAMVKLTSEQVQEIRRRRATGEQLIPIAQDFGVTFQTISRIALNQRRQHA